MQLLSLDDAQQRGGLMVPAGISRSGVDTAICIFVSDALHGSFIFVSKYHSAPRSVFDAIRAKEYRCAAEDTQHGKLESELLGRAPTFFLISRYHSSPSRRNIILLFVLSRSALKQLQNERRFCPLRDGFFFLLSAADVIFLNAGILEMFVRA